MQKLRKAYNSQKADARRRGIIFVLTFDQWLRVWKQSGKLAKRGVKRGQYVMARYGDVGPYAIGNIKIITTEKNVIEKNKRMWRTDFEYRAKMLEVSKRPKPYLIEIARERALGNKWSLGRVMSAETRARISESKRRKIDAERKSA